MNFTVGYFTTSIGKKIVVAITGILLLGFVIAHMAGNLQIYAGAEKINAYAKFLKDLGPALWIARIGLLVAVALHIYFTVQLKLENKAARPVKYAYMKTKQASSASLYMIISGLTVLAFIVYHLLHFTLGVTNPNYLEYEYILNGEKVHDVYMMVVTGFQVPLVSIAYIIAMGLLCWHLTHGVASIFQTLGIDSPKHSSKIRQFAYGVSAIIFVGNVSIPLTILLGIVR
jgi:succinate dehydrogenase / fumarate reductase, cytochrome b subunit